MLRLFWGAFALACGVTQAFPAPPTPADDSGSAPMRFEWRREGPAEERVGHVDHLACESRLRGAPRL